MEFPALMPRALLHYETATSEEQLFGLLIQKPLDLVFFFEVAAADETWTELHADLIVKILEWLTNQSFNNEISIDLCKRTAKAIQAHHHVLERMIPKNITVQLSDATIQSNSLLLTAISNFFRNILSIECREKNCYILNLKPVSFELFSPIQTFAFTGNIPDIWKKEQQEVEALLRQALSWEVDDISKACQLTLKKYIHSENAIDLLIQAQSELWGYFKQECIDFINARMSGFTLGAPTEERLSFEFCEYNDEALRIFQRLRPWITDLVCRKALAEDSHFSRVIRQCPKLLLLDIRGSFVFSDSLKDIPNDLQGLDLSECAWLDQKSLRSIAEICPYVKDLRLSNNYQLNFSAWGELVKFKNLKSLNLSHCHQISDEDLTTIFKACQGLTDFNIDHCRKIGDKGFFELAKSLRRLTSLSLVRCSISDSALLEIAVRSKVLTSLDLSHCDQLTEKGFKELAKHAFVLKELNLSQCKVSISAIEEMRLRHPYLNIEGLK